jgi:hypothetical protein
MFPKCLCLIRNVEKHGLSRMEIVVRMIVFVPFLVLFSAPKALTPAVAVLLWIWGKELLFPVSTLYPSSI